MEIQEVQRISRNLLALCEVRGQEVQGRVVIGVGCEPAGRGLYLMAVDEMGGEVT